MLPSILSDPRLFVMLFRIDFELSEQTRGEGCPFCGGKLHSARYRRKPRGAGDLSPEHEWRFSFCCASEGCRRRTNPPSVRFLGRRVYLGVVVVLVAACTQGPSPERVQTLREQLGVDRRTLKRWREWWRELFPRTSFWKEARSRLMPPAEEASLPASLVSRFATETLKGVLGLLRFLAPISISNRVS